MLLLNSRAARTARAGQPGDPRGRLSDGDGLLLLLAAKAVDEHVLAHPIDALDRLRQETDDARQVGSRGRRARLRVRRP